MQLFGLLIPEKEQLVETAREVVKGKACLSLYLSLFGLAIGMYAIAAIFIKGHAHTINTSNLVPWGLQISTYIYFALLSTTLLKPFPACDRVFITIGGLYGHTDANLPFFAKDQAIAFATLGYRFY